VSTVNESIKQLYDKESQNKRIIAHRYKAMKKKIEKLNPDGILEEKEQNALSLSTDEFKQVDLDCHRLLQEIWEQRNYVHHICNATIEFDEHLLDLFMRQANDIISNTKRSRDSANESHEKYKKCSADEENRFLYVMEENHKKQIESINNLGIGDLSRHVDLLKSAAFLPVVTPCEVETIRVP